ncbi:hypothetical protein ABI59_19150 [Acidobacteria bacterium Mor1]|nr:hypothetical protein ABI59_19150 [Acidobacteria bacterium Mor1]
MNRLFQALGIALLAASTPGILASEPVATDPVVDEIDPAIASSESETEIAVTGDGFEPDARVALWNATGARLIGSSEDPQTFSVAVVGEYAYTGSGYSSPSTRRFTTWNVGDPENPQIVSEYPVSRPIRSIMRIGDMIYALNDFLVLFDISQPEAPAFMDRIIFGFGVDASDAVLAGNHLYVSLRNNHFVVLDVSDPRRPSIVATADTSSSAHAVTYSKGFLYLTADKLMVFDVRDPLQPSLVTEQELENGTAYQLAAAGDTIYAGNFETFTSIDVSNPADPQTLATLDFFYVQGIRIYDDLAYVAGGRGLRIVDIGDPANPTLIAEGRNPIVTEDVAVEEGIAYVADGNGGFRIFDVNHPRQPAVRLRETIRFQFGPYTRTTMGVSVDTAEGLTFVGNGTSANGMNVFDLRDPDNIQRYDLFQASFPFDLIHDDGFVYLGDFFGLHVADVREPTNPTVVHSGESRGLHMALEGDRLYLASHTDGVTALNVETPTTPQLLGGLDLGGSARKIAIQDGIAFVGGYFGTFPEVSDWLHVVDMTDPAQPSVLARLDFPETVNALVSIGDHLAVGTPTTFSLFDITDPSRPTTISTLTLPWARDRNIEHQEGTIFLTGYHGAPGRIGEGHGIYLIDIRDPQRPHIYDRIITTGEPWDVAVRGNQLHIADGTRGFAVMDFNPPAETLVVPSAAEIEGRVPAGMSSGSYDVVVAQESGSSHLRSGFRVCASREFEIKLQPDAPGATQLMGGPVTMRLELSGDASILNAGSSRRAELLLPDRPQPEQVAILPAPDGNTTLQLDITNAGTEVTLFAVDQEMGEALWQRIGARGFIELPALDSASYGPVDLGTRPPIGRNAATRYTYRLNEVGELEGSVGFGVGVDHLLRVQAPRPDGCVDERTLFFAEERRRICNELAGAIPGLAGDCR